MEVSSGFAFCCRVSAGLRHSLSGRPSCCRCCSARNRFRQRAYRMRTSPDSRRRKQALFSLVEMKHVSMYAVQSLVLVVDSSSGRSPDRCAGRRPRTSPAPPARRDRALRVRTPDCTSSHESSRRSTPMPHRRSPIRPRPPGEPAFHRLIERIPQRAPRGAEADLLKRIYESVAAVGRRRQPEVHPSMKPWKRFEA